MKESIEKKLGYTIEEFCRLVLDEAQKCLETGIADDDGIETRLRELTDEENEYYIKYIKENFSSIVGE